MSAAASHRQIAARLPGSLEVRLLGTVDFDAAIALQERVAYELSGRRDTNGVLVLCEHPPVISIGREGSRSQVLATEEQLAAAGSPVRWVSRSGGAVVHVPGQLAAYLLLPLDRLMMAPGEYRRRFEEALLGVCHDLRVPAKRLDDGPGLWTRGGQIGHFGAVVKSWVTQQGMWLNVAPEASWLRLVRSELAGIPRPIGGTVPASPRTARGVVEERVTSLQQQLSCRVFMHAARDSALRHIAESFGYDTVHTFTGHPALYRQRRRVLISV